MADISDVENSLANTITAILYPDGSTGSTIAGVTCRIYRGWPNSATLNSDLNAGVVNVTLSSDNDSGKTTTRYLPEYMYQTAVPTLTATVVGNLVQVAGAASIGNVIGVLIDGAAYAYRVVAGDTPPLVAANLCAAVQVGHIATLNGSDITIPFANSVSARVVCDGSSSFEGRRQEKDIRVIFWCPSPASRDNIASSVDLAISAIGFLELADNTKARISYRNSAGYDQSQNALLYRRDLIYCVEYATVITDNLPSMLFGGASINDSTRFG